VAHFAGNAQLGIYSLAYTLGSIIFMIAMAFNTAWTPYFFELLEQNTVQSKTKIVKITYLFIAGLFIATLGLSVLTPFIFKYFINEKFSEGAAIVPWVAFSCFFFGCYVAFTNYISYLKIVNITLNMLLNFLLIKQYGIFGAALATFCSFGFFALIIAFVAIKIYPMPWLNVSFKTLKLSDE
jgi:O-antigen/teichoic acid export membrane protein